MPVSPPKSPYKRALAFQELLPAEKAKRFSSGRQIAYTRICQFLPDMVEQLEDAEAPEHVYKWVAFGKTLPDRIVRLALALYLRKPINPKKPGQSLSGLTWLFGASQSVAEKIFYETVQGSTLREWIRNHMFQLRGAGGRMDPAFWREVNDRVRATDVTSFLQQVSQRVLLKPKRRIRMYGGQVRRSGRSLTKTQIKALKQLLEENGVSVGTPDEGDI